MIPANWRMPNVSAKPSWMARNGADVRNENSELTTLSVPLRATRNVRTIRTARRRQRFFVQK